MEVSDGLWKARRYIAQFTGWRRLPRETLDHSLENFGQLSLGSAVLPNAMSSALQGALSKRS